MRLIAHDSYEFSSTAHWPEDDYSLAVERGVRDGLWESGYDPDLGIRVLLEDIEYDRINSSERSFYLAAKCATKAKAEIRHNADA